MSNPVGFVLPALSIGLGTITFRPKRGFFPASRTNDKGQDTTAFESQFAPIIAHATLVEQHHDEMMITEHPVEQGAAIADHAYKRPARVVIRCAWSNSPPANIGLLNQAIGVGGAVALPVGVLASLQPTIAAARSMLSGNSPGQVRDIYDQLLALQARRILFDVFTGKRRYTNMLMQTLSTETEQRTENALMIVAVCQEVIIVSTQTVTVPADASAHLMPHKTAPVVSAGFKSLVPGVHFNPRPLGLRITNAVGLSLP